MNKLQIILLLVSSFCIVSNNYTSVQVQVVKYCTVNGVKKTFQELGISSENSGKDASEKNKIDAWACKNKGGLEYSVGRTIAFGSSPITYDANGQATNQDAYTSTRVFWTSYLTTCEENKHCCVGGGQYQDKNVENYLSCIKCCSPHPSKPVDQETIECHMECINKYVPMPNYDNLKLQLDKLKHMTRMVK